MLPREDEARTGGMGPGVARQASFVAMNEISPSLQVMKVNDDGTSEIEEVSRSHLLQMANDYAKKSRFLTSNIRPRDLRILDAMFEPSLAVRQVAHHYCSRRHAPF